MFVEDRLTMKAGTTSEIPADKTGATVAIDARIGVYRPILWCLGLLAVCAWIFFANPGLDLAVSRLFYWPERGFYLGQTAPVVAIRTLGMWVTGATIAGLLGLALWWRLKPEALARWPSPRPLADWLFIAAGMALGPGLLVNLIFKPVWGRARPRHIEQFGGHDHFSAAWVVSDQCAWGCSFVSGEAAATAFVLAFCFVVPARWRVPTLVAGCVFTLAVSFARLAAGGHFLSDVVTAWLLTVLLMLVLRAQIYHGALLGPLKRWLPL